jgi:hypothetical protein
MRNDEQQKGDENILHSLYIKGTYLGRVNFSYAGYPIFKICLKEAAIGKYVL